MLDYIGLLSVFGSVILFGIFSLPTKTNNLGDGIVFQLFMCIGIWLVGFAYYLIQCLLRGSCSSFSPLAATGGAIWCLSNLLLTPIVKCIGVGLAMITWGLNECLMGWATGRFGLFGVKVEPPINSLLNTAGVIVMVFSLLLISLAQPSVSDSDESDFMHRKFDDMTTMLEISLNQKLHETNDEEERGIEEGGEGERIIHKRSKNLSFEENGYDVTQYLSPHQKRLFGFFSCILCGALSGSTFTAPQFVVDKSNGSIDLLDLLFSHFCGILGASILFFAIYCLASQGKPWVKSDILLPSMLGGICWGLACYLWFVANEKLSMVIAFPIVTIGPGVLSLVLGCVVYNEVQGVRNIALLIAAVLVYSGGAVMIALSNN